MGKRIHVFGVSRNRVCARWLVSRRIMAHDKVVFKGVGERCQEVGVHRGGNG